MLLKVELCVTSDGKVKISIEIEKGKYLKSYNGKKNKITIDKIFSPDNKNGVSKWLTVKEVIDGGLRWSKNGNIRHGICWNDNRYIWETKRKNERKTGEVIAIRTSGFSKKKFLLDLYIVISENFI